MAEELSITFLVQGSAPYPYRVVFRKNGNNMTAQCDCPAGEVQQYCKHRFRILDGNKEGIVSNNADAVKTISIWLIGSDVEAAIKEVTAAEQRVEKAKKELSGFKKKLARAMTD